MLTPEERERKKEQFKKVEPDLTVKLLSEFDYPEMAKGKKQLLKHHDWVSVIFHAEGIRFKTRRGVVNVAWHNVRGADCQPKLLDLVVTGGLRGFQFIPNGGQIDKRQEIEAIIKKHAPDAWQNAGAREQVKAEVMHQAAEAKARNEELQRNAADQIRAQSGVLVPQQAAQLASQPGTQLVPQAEAQVSAEARIVADKALLVDKWFKFGSQILLNARIHVSQGRIWYDKKSVALIGAEVSVEDASKRRVTATRLVTGGALLGASAMKTTGNAYIIIDGTDGQLRVAVKLQGKKDFERYVSPQVAELTTVIRQATSAQAPLTQPVPEPVPQITPAEPPSDPLSQIQKLGELRDAGLLTQDEFDLKKAELLKRV